MSKRLTLLPIVEAQASRLLLNLAAGSLPILRQLAILNALAPGLRLARDQLMATVKKSTERGCYGQGTCKTQFNLFSNDLAALRRLGVAVRYSRRPGRDGYYWSEAERASVARAAFDSLNYESIAALTAATAAERFRAIAQLADLAAATYVAQETRFHPEATPEQLRARILKRIQSHARRERTLLR